jgi:uncharacterized protein (DUF488 family)
MSVQEVFTIGYEGREIEDFISRLKAFNITRLIDIREIPLSRKRGFSKFALKRRVEAENIEYVHLKTLGSPSILRHQLRADHDYEQFFSAFLSYLSKNHNSLIEAYGYLQDGPACLMCFERFPDKCHRSAVAQKIKEHDGNGLKISHI